MSPSDFPDGPFPIMLSRKRLDEVALTTDQSAAGTSQVSAFSFNARCSLTPRTVRRLHSPVAWSPILDFALCERLVTVKLTRLNRIHFRCGWRLCFHESQPCGLLHKAVGKLRVKQVITRQTPFSLREKANIIGETTQVATKLQHISPTNDQNTVDHDSNAFSIVPAKKKIDVDFNGGKLTSNASSPSPRIRRRQ